MTILNGGLGEGLGGKRGEGLLQGKSYQVVKADAFEYTDLFDGSVLQGEVLQE